MFRVLVIFWCLAAAAPAQAAPEPAYGGKPATPPAPSESPDTTALGALALLPKDAASRVARVEGPEGHPFPERWYVLVHDPAFPAGSGVCLFRGQASGEPSAIPICRQAVCRRRNRGGIRKDQ
jgi:hypothetical protein